jgi:hypothetical protein
MKHFMLGTLFVFLCLMIGCKSPIHGTAPGTNNTTGTEDTSTGTVVVQISTEETGLPSGTIGGVQVVYPDMTFVKYTLGFTHDDGTSAPEQTLTNSESVQVELKAGAWTISATGFVRTGETDTAVIQGSVPVTVETGITAAATILLNKPIDIAGGNGAFSYDIVFPSELVNSAVFTVEKMGDDGTLTPYNTIDFVIQYAQNQYANTITIPAGFYRMNIRLSTIYSYTGETDFVYIHPGLETKLLMSFDETDFPLIKELNGAAELAAWLETLPENTEDNPYPVKLMNIDLSSTANSGDTLKTVCAALTRFVTLDLRGCTGNKIPNFSGTAAKAKICSLILPDTVIEIENNAFTGYSALVSVEMPKVTKVGYGVFKELNRLETVSMPEVTIIVTANTAASGTFRSCTALNSVYLPKVESIGDYAFYDCSSLAAISLPCAQTIGRSAFSGDSNLITAALPLVETIGSSAFAGNTALQSITLGSVPPTLGGSNVFTNANALSAIYVPAAAVNTYKETTKDNWSAKLKEKVAAIPNG